MFEKYTEKARRAIFFARYEASQFGSPVIDTEHLLLGVVREDRPLAVRFLPGRAEDAIRTAIEKEKPLREKISTSVDLPLSEAGKKALGYAAEEAERFAHKHLGTEHLFLGLLRAENTMAARILQQFGLKLDTAREKMAADLRARAAESAEPFTFATRRSMSLEDFGQDLTGEEAHDDHDSPPLIGRERELEQLMRILSCRGRRNAVLVGEPGVGKRAIVRGLARQIANGAAPADFSERPVVSLDIEVIVSGLKSRRLFEENLEGIAGELKHNTSLIFFADDLHTLAATKPRCLAVANVLKAAMLNGAIQCISTATPEGYRKAVAAERWLEQLFQTVEVSTPGPAEALGILRGTKSHYEKFHEVEYTDEALRYAVFHSHNYILQRNLPEKALDLIDEAGAHAKIHRQPWPEEIAAAQGRVRLAVRDLELAIANHEFEKARYYSDEERAARHQVKQLLQKHGLSGLQTVARADIEEIVSQWTGIPLATIRASRIPQNPTADPAERD